MYTSLYGIFKNRCLSIPKYWERIFKVFGEVCIRGDMMLKSRIGVLLRTSKYRREFILNELGISKNTLTNWSSGVTYPTIDKAYILADLLEVDINELYEREEKKPPN